MVKPPLVGADPMPEFDRIYIMFTIGERLKFTNCLLTEEEMTRYVMSLILESCINPHLDTSAWRVYSLSYQSRDRTNDQVLFDAVVDGSKVRSIFKGPTITPTASQVKRLRLSKALASPNDVMGREWNGFTISRVPSISTASIQVQRPRSL